MNFITKYWWVLLLLLVGVAIFLSVRAYNKANALANVNRNVFNPYDINPIGGGIA